MLWIFSVLEKVLSPKMLNTFSGVFFFMCRPRPTRERAEFNHLRKIDWQSNTQIYSILSYPILFYSFLF